MNPAAIGMKVLKSKWTWIVILVIILLIVARPAFAKAWASLMRKDLGNYNQDLNDQNNTRLLVLQQLAESIVAATNGLPSFQDERPELFREALAINDTELKYLATYYKQISGGESLRTTVEGEWSTIGDTDERLVARLLKLDL